MKNRLALAFLVLAIGVAGTLTYWIAKPWGERLTIAASCKDTHTAYQEILRADVVAFRACTSRRAKLFYERDYVEAKDLAKAFLTLLGAMLVTSITFSEKIVNVQSGNKVPLCAMVICWLSLLSAIAFTGGGLAWMADAAGFATYIPEMDIRGIEAFAVRLFIFGGLAFGLALAAMIFAGVVSLMYGQRASA
jgi:hypothetical protein